MSLLNRYQLYKRTTIFFVNSIRYISSFSIKNQFLCNRFDNLHSKTRNPSKRFNFDEHRALSLAYCNVISVRFCSYSGGGSNEGSWLGNWSGIHKGGKLQKPELVSDYRNYGYSSNSDGEDNNGSRTDVRGSTMKRIVEKLKKSGYLDDDVGERKEEERGVIEKGSIQDVFHMEEVMLPNPRGGFSRDTPLGDETVFGRRGDDGFPWQKKEVREMFTVKPKSRYSSAETTLPRSELLRLKYLAFQIKTTTKTNTWTRITRAGVTQEIVDKINAKWKSSELVMFKIKAPLVRNMPRMHGILEKKTGGLVIWRHGPFVSLYRGINYEAPSEKSNKRSFQEDDTRSKVPAISDGTSELAIRYNPSHDSSTTQADSSYPVEEEKGITRVSEVSYEDEIDHLLAGLGPRYTDWPGSGPLPVDACLLPTVIPGYQPPLRLLPYGVRSTLGDKEATALKRLARVLPPHFAVGRCRQHQGLATAMLKLWERSVVAKVALKCGVQLTTSEEIAEDIKRMTGGILLSRNKYFMVFYRGKDFLRPDVAEALLEKERLKKSLQNEVRISNATLGETLDARWGKKLNEDIDPQSISDEERFMFRKLGLRMKTSLLLRRREIFDSTVENMHFRWKHRTVENMHLRWKYRELIKIIIKEKNFEHIKIIAISLEAESGGVLVSIDKVSKGYAIIFFRGKDYKWPSTLRPINLLTKRKALAISIELQRREALLNHISTVRAELEQMASVKVHLDEELYNKLDSSYLSVNEDSKEEGDGWADEETYEPDTNFIDEIVVSNEEVETNFPYVLQDESEAKLDYLWAYSQI